MSNKNKTISFRVNEDAFGALQRIAEERDISLSAVFRDYVDTLIENDGQVVVVSKDEFARAEEEETFPPTVEVPKSFLREHERLELETEHLREQLEEHKAYVNDLRDHLEKDEEEVLLLDDLDEDEPYQLG